jgi:hypothetical protein
VFKDRPATRAGFRRVGGVNEGDFTIGTRSLAREELPKHEPTAVEDALAQVLVAYHVANAQVFQRDPIVVAHKFGRQLVREVAPLVGDMLMPTLDGKQLLASVLAAFLGTRKLTLQPSQLCLPRPVVVWVLDLFAVAGGDQRGDTHVDPDDAPCLGQRRSIRYFAGETGVPLACLMDDPHRLDCAFNRTMPADGNAPDTKQFQAPPVYLRANPVLLKLKAVEAVASLEARVARLFARLRTAKEGLERRVNLLDNALRGLAKHLLSIRERGAVAFRKLLGVGKCDLALFNLVGILAFCQRHVVQVAGAMQDAVQVLFLCPAWIEAIFENADARARIAHALTPRLSEGWWAFPRRDQHLYFSTNVHPAQLPPKFG